MGNLRFEWDTRKDSANQRKHGVSFAEAEAVFVDEHALLMDDPEHWNSEDRFILLGLSSALRMLVVVRCYRESKETIRIISARKSTKSERLQYDARWKR